MWSTEKSEGGTQANFSIGGMKDYGIAKKTIQYIQVNQVIERSKTNKTEAEKNLKQAELDFMIYLKALLHKTPIDPKLIQLKICLKNQRKKGAPEVFSSFQRNHQTIGFLICKW